MALPTRSELEQHNAELTRNLQTAKAEIASLKLEMYKLRDEKASQALKLADAFDEIERLGMIMRRYASDERHSTHTHNTNSYLLNKHQ